jgi:hypothetical protein
MLNFLLRQATVFKCGWFQGVRMCDNDADSVNGSERGAGGWAEKGRIEVAGEDDITTVDCETLSRNAMY